MDEGSDATVAAGGFNVSGVSYAIQSLEEVSAALGEEIHGILGYGLFRDVILTFDYPRREVRLDRGRLDLHDADVFP